MNHLPTIMENNIYQIRLTVEDMHRLMQKLVAQRTCGSCAVELSLQENEQPAPENLPAEERFNRAGAAYFLNKSERQVLRYRVSGKLSYGVDEKNQVYFLRSELERLFEKLWGFPKR